LTKQHKAGLALIIVLVMIRFVIVPWLNWTDSKVEAIQALNQNKKRFQSIQLRNVQLTTQEQTIADGYQRLSALWFAGKTAQAPVQVLQHVEQLAQKHQVELSTRQTGQPAVTEGASVMPVSLFVQGRPQYIYAFLASLESQQPLAVVQNLRLTKPSAASQNMTATLDLNILLQPEDVI
tara:strand:- start:15633 stop:16169 length:537 start_codon:yes stop_codon:yes gene_type:complete